MVPDTQIAALEAVQQKIPEVHETILEVLRLRGAATADEIAEVLYESRLFIRPRISELHKAGKIEKTGLRRRNYSGLSATVWRVAA